MAKSLSTALQALLASRQFWRCDLYVITLVGGGVLRYASGDCNVKDASGNVYFCGGMTGPYWDRDGKTGTKSTVHQKLGTDVDTMTIDLIPGASTLMGLPWLPAVREGLLRGAWFQRLTAYAPLVPAAGAWPVAVTGTVIRFTGEIAEIDGGDSAITLTINSPLQRLQNQWPRNTYSPTCLNILGDTACGVNVSTYQAGGTVTAGSTNAVILSNLGQASGWWSLGTIAFTSGINAGLTRSLRTFAAGTPSALVLMTPFPQAPSAGDRFTVSPGCDGSMDGYGCPRFNNLAAFRGFLDIPAPTTAGGS